MKNKSMITKHYGMQISGYRDGRSTSGTAERQLALDGFEDAVSWADTLHGIQTP